jgi:hypothetical protein
MTKDDVLRMAQQWGDWNGQTVEFNDVGLERFAKLVQLTTVTPAQIAHVNAIERTLTDEKIGELWHLNGGFHHHFARAVERYLKGEE